MNVKEATRKAVAYVADLFEEEQISNLGLEEVEFDETADCWKVTVGFSRPWQVEKGSNSSLALLRQQGDVLKRAYKVITIKDANAEVVSVKNRSLNTA